MINNYNDKLFDKEFRTKLINNPNKVVHELMTNDILNTNNEALEYKVVKSKKGVINLVIPYYNSDFNNKRLEELNAAGSISTGSSAGTLGSVGSILTIGGTFSSVFSVGSAGTAGSAGSVDVEPHL